MLRAWCCYRVLPLSAEQLIRRDRSELQSSRKVNKTLASSSQKYYYYTFARRSFSPLSALVAGATLSLEHGGTRNKLRRSCACVFRSSVFFFSRTFVCSSLPVPSQECGGLSVAYTYVCNMFMCGPGRLVSAVVVIVDRPVLEEEAEEVLLLLLEVRQRFSSCSSRGVCFGNGGRGGSVGEDCSNSTNIIATTSSSNNYAAAPNEY